jgi:hypothetical protein
MIQGMTLGARGGQKDMALGTREVHKCLTVGTIGRILRARAVHKGLTLGGREDTNAEAVFLVVSDPSMNEL